MNKPFFIILYVFTISIAIHSCTYDNEEDLLMEEGAPIVVPDTVSYSKDVQPLIANNCYGGGCHGAGTGSGRGDFTTYAGVKTKVDNGSFEKEVIVDKTMPQLPGRLSDNEIQLLKKWLDQGALNN